MSPKVFDQSGWLSGGVRSAGGLPSNPNNLPPVADFNYTPTLLSVVFTSISTDPDGTIVNTAWDFGDGNTGSGTPVTHVYGSAGSYDVTITVTDDDSASDQATRTVAVVASGGTAPICDFLVSKSGLVGTFTDNSTDDVAVTSWLWDFGDGTTSTAQNPPAHTYSTGGAKTVKLTVHDGAGNSASRTRTPIFSASTGTGRRKMISSQAMDTSRFGTAVTPDSEEQATSAGAWLAATTGYIDKARAAGSGGRAKSPPCMLIFKCTPGNAALKDAKGEFVLKNWTDAFDNFYNAAMALTSLPKPGGGTYANGIAKLRDAVKDGTIAFHYALDDFGGAADQTDDKANGFTTPVSWYNLEAIAFHQKVTRQMNWLPVGGRAAAHVFKSRLNEAITANVVGPGGVQAKFKYQYMDVAWCQMRLDRDGDVGTYINTECDDAAFCRLSMKGGGNLLNGGRWEWTTTDHTKTGPKQHSDVAWRQRLTGETDAQYDFRMHPNLDNLFGMSPAEVKELGLAMLGDTDNRVLGFDLWRGDGGDGSALAYWSRSDIQAAMLTVYNASKDLTDKPYNVRGDLVDA